MIEVNSPFKLTTRFRGWSRVMAIGLFISIALNFYLVHAINKQSDNLSIPRIVMRTPSGMVLPVAASAFVWTPEVATDYVKKFLPVCYTFSPDSPPSVDTWSPFINPQLLKSAVDRFRKDQTRIQSEGFNQTMLVREVKYDEASETAIAVCEVRVIDRNGRITRNPVTLTVEFTTYSDPLNPYGHIINSYY